MVIDLLSSGRVARAGRSGTAYSLLATDELAYYVDLHLFLGRPLKIMTRQEAPTGDGDWDGYLGRVSQNVIDDGDCAMKLWHQQSVELTNLVCPLFLTSLVI